MVNNKSLFLKEYKKLDKEFNTHNDETYEYIVNFSGVKDKPIHRWAYYQEGYSPDLVLNILSHLGISEKKTLIFDPFSGSGTTLLTAKQLGMKAIGFEINPYSALLIKVKTRNYSNADISEIKEFVFPRYKKLNNLYDKYELRIIKELFSEENLNKIELLKHSISAISNKRVKELLFVALLSIVESISNYRKGGNGLKKKKYINKLDPFHEFKFKIDQVCEDLQKANKGPEPLIINDSCLNADSFKAKNIDISIFSPPYANCFDPFEVYKMELWIGQFVSSYDELRSMRRKALTSNLNADVNKNISSSHRTHLLGNILTYLSTANLWDKRLCKMLDAYFYDMCILLDKLYAGLKKGGYCVIVVGNSSYGQLPIPTDILLAQIGKKIGYRVKEIIIARKNEASSQQYNKLGPFLNYMRESLIVLKK